MVFVELTGTAWYHHRGTTVQAERAGENFLEIRSLDDGIDGAVVVLAGYTPKYPGDLDYANWGGELVTTPEED